MSIEQRIEEAIASRRDGWQWQGPYLVNKDGRILGEVHQLISSWRKYSATAARTSLGEFASEEQARKAVERAA